MSREARLEVHTPRKRITLMSTNGSDERSSVRTQKASTPADVAMRPQKRIDPQPQFCPSLTASKRPPRPSESSSAAYQLTRPGLRTGDSGTIAQVAMKAAPSVSNGIQNNQ